MEKLVSEKVTSRQPARKGPSSSESCPGKARKRGRRKEAKTLQGTANTRESRPPYPPHVELPPYQHILQEKLEQSLAKEGEA
jgi:hypothetical protein